MSRWRSGGLGWLAFASTASSIFEPQGGPSRCFETFGAGHENLSSRVRFGASGAAVRDAVYSWCDLDFGS